MPNRIFISHGGPDTPVALQVAQELEARGLTVDVDRDQLRAGDVFIAFMERSLAAADYCLLLWSHHAAAGKWVAVEWEAALYRAIEESRRFLLIGRLDAHPLPVLLGPRLRVELFPALYPGLQELFALWEQDVKAEDASGRRVANAAVKVAEDERGGTVYVTSELFGLTQPLRLDFNVPAGVHLDRLIAELGLPRQLDVKGVIGARYDYRFVHDDRPLSRAPSLTAQGVGEGAVLWLEVEFTPFAKGQPISGELTSAKFRTAEASDATTDARRELLAAISRAGLGV
jgi:TIR domain-containing protein